MLRGCRGCCGADRGGEGGLSSSAATIDDGEWWWWEGKLVTWQTATNNPIWRGAGRGPPKVVIRTLILPRYASLAQLVTARLATCSELECSNREVCNLFFSLYIYILGVSGPLLRMADMSPFWVYTLKISGLVTSTSIYDIPKIHKNE